MGTIANLAVSLTAKTAEFTSGFKKASKTVSDFTGTVGAVVGKVGGIASALAGLAGAASVTWLVKSSMEAMDATGKLSDTLGISTEKLVGLQHAAKLAGVGQEDLTKALSKTVLLHGSADAFYKVADKISGMTDSGDRAKLAFKEFGNNWRALMPMLMQGSGGLAAMQKEAEKLGLTFSRIESAQVKAANDSLKRLGEIITGISTKLAVQLAPFIEAVNARLVGMATNGEGMGLKVVGAFEWVCKAVAKVTDYFNILKGTFYVLASGFGTMVQGFLTGMAKLGQAMAWLQKHSNTESGRTAGRLAEKYWQGVESEGDAWGKQAEKNALIATQAFDSFASGENGKKVTDFFKAIRDESKTNATKVAEDMAKMNAPEDGEDIVGKKKAGGDTFKSISLRRFAIEGPGGLAATQTRRQDVKAAGVEQRLDNLYNLIASNQGAAVALLG